jgi:alpha-L-fucosidase 2
MMNSQLLFDQPSLRFNEGLPIGNGRLGAVVTGGLPEKHLLLNEETVWYGGPRDRNNPDAIRYIGQIRELMRAGSVREAQRLAVMALTGVPESQRHYATLGMVVLDLFHDGTVEDYQRMLDFDTAVVTERYRIAGSGLCLARWGRCGCTCGRWAHPCPLERRRRGALHGC